MITFSDINWGSIADWASGIGSLSAVITALYLSRSAQRIKLHGLCGHRVVVEQGQKSQSLISIIVTNTGMRTTNIKSIGLRFGLFQKRYAILKLQKDKFMDPIPRPLGDGEQAHWGIPLDEKQKWIDDLFKSSFVKSWIDVETMVVQVHTRTVARLTSDLKKHYDQ
jgi:hypothetical protein